MYIVKVYAACQSFGLPFNRIFPDHRIDDDGNKSDIVGAVGQRLKAVTGIELGEDTDPQTLHDALKKIQFRFNLELFDRSGKWIAGSYSSLPNVVTDKGSRHMRLGEKRGRFSTVITNPNTESPFYAIKIEIKFRNNPVVRRLFFGYMLSGFFVILVSSFVGWRLVAHLNKRLERLKSGVSKVSQGEFVRIEVVGKDEIAFLARSFNLMSQRIKKLVENLEESNAARQRLLAHASHEIKSPLTSVKGFINIIEFDLEKTTALSADPERLSQILDNLWNNALKYGDLSHPIQTSLVTDNHVIHIKISNYLVAKLDIPPERLFEPFYRNPATADKVTGSGLGLAIVHELTDKLNGKIQTRLTDEMIEIELLFGEEPMEGD
ncbi:HAMP domain-containing histidine kinase [bacterium]|nr:HAMP domain-containing histidine kinase [bacterium]